MLWKMNYSWHFRTGYYIVCHIYNHEPCRGRHNIRNTRHNRDSITITSFIWYFVGLRQSWICHDKLEALQRLSVSSGFRRICKSVVRWYAVFYYFLSRLRKQLPFPEKITIKLPLIRIRISYWDSFRWNKIKKHKTFGATPRTDFCFIN